MVVDGDDSSASSLMARRSDFVNPDRKCNVSCLVECLSFSQAGELKKLTRALLVTKVLKTC